MFETVKGTILFSVKVRQNQITSFTHSLHKCISSNHFSDKELEVLLAYAEVLSQEADKIKELVNEAQFERNSQLEFILK